jgi:hypothetical protein
MKKTTSRALVTAVSVISLSAGIFACAAESTGATDGTTGTTQEAICLNYPCTRLSGGTSGRLTSSSGGLVMDPGPTTPPDPNHNAVICDDAHMGPVAGHPEAHWQMIEQKDANGNDLGYALCQAVVPVDCNIPDAKCGGFAVISTYTCVWPGQTVHCDRLTGTCACY